MKKLFTLFIILFAVKVIAQPSGSLDPTFGNGGKVVTSITSGQDKAFGVAIQSDSKIIVAGYSTNTITGKDFAVVRYKTDGTLDSTFGNNGIVTTDLQIGSEDVAYSVALQSDGKIILAGYSDNGSNKDAALIRYNSNGTIDSTFGTNGIVITDFENNQQDEIKVLKIHQLTGNIIVGGASAISTSIGKPVIARYTSSGNLDTSFNSTGIKLLWIVANDNARIFSVEDLVVASNGKISAVGWRKQISTTISIEYWACRVLSNGVPDISFSGDGVVQYGDGNGTSSAYGLLLNSNQDFILCGTKQYSVDYSFRLLKINANGTIPASSIYYTGYTSGINKANKIAEDNNGNFVFIGNSGSATNSSFTIGRLNSADLTADINFGTSGFTSTTFGNAINECYNLSIQSDNKIVVVGYSGTDFSIARFVGEDTPLLNDFQLLSPADLSVNQNFSSINLDWTDAYGFSSYVLEIDTNQNFGNPQSYTVYMSFRTVNNLLSNTKYYWRVKATDDVNYGAYTPIWSFTTNSLNNFNLLSPANNSLNQAFATITLDWSNVIGADNYLCEIDTNQNFTGTLQSFNVTSSSKTITGLCPNTKYYWRVKAGASSIFGDYSSTWNFNTNSLENFSLISPSNNSINQTYNSLTFDWSDISGVTNYQLQIDSNQSFAGNPSIYNSTNSTYTITNLRPSTNYYWRVKASANGTTFGLWSPTWKCTTKTDNTFLYEYLPSKTFQCYPNPNTGNFTINLEKNFPSVGITIINNLGQTVYTNTFKNTADIKIDFNSPEGVYLVLIKLGNDETYKTTIIIKH